MGFSMDDVMEVIQIVKQCKDTELHIATGDIKLSIYRGDVGDSTRSPMAFSGAACASEQPQIKAAPAATAPAPPAPVPEDPSPTVQGKNEVQEAEKAPPAEEKEEISEEGLHKVKASVPSVFYRKPSPEEPPFVELGDQVQEDTVLCLLEVMKCYRQVMAEVKGRIVKICVESNTPVEEGTTLFLIQPE